MKEHIRQIIEENQLLNDKQPIIIAVSGGSDSIALLHILSSLYPSLKRIAVYIDHGLRPHEVAAEKLLVEQQAMSLAATFVSQEIDVASAHKQQKCSLEEIARKLRYKALETIRRKYQAQATAVGHTSDDQAEEVLLRLIRGSGSAGLGGMAMQNGVIIRPLLQESKKSLRKYLQRHSISYCEDSSNNDTRFLRNKIRQDLLPHLEQEYNGSIRKTLLQTASILQEENKFLKRECDALFKKLCSATHNSISLSLSPFSPIPLAIQRRIIEKICWQLGVKPSFPHITALLALAEGQTGTEIHLAKGLRAIKERDTILFHFPATATGYRGPAVPEKTFPPHPIPSPGRYTIQEIGYKLTIKYLTYNKELLREKDNLLLDSEKILFPLLLRQHRDGESFHPLGSPGRKKIARFLTDQKISGLEKANYPVLVQGTIILAVMGLRINHHYRIREKTKTCIQLQWRKI